MGFVFTQLVEKTDYQFTHLPFWREPTSLIWLFNEWRSLNVNSFAFIIRKLPLAPFPQFGLPGLATFVVCTPSPFGDVTGLNRVFYVRVRGVKPLAQKVPRSGWPFSGRAFLFVPTCDICWVRTDQFAYYLRERYGYPTKNAMSFCGSEVGKKFRFPLIRETLF